MSVIQQKAEAIAARLATDPDAGAAAGFDPAMIAAIISAISAIIQAIKGCKKPPATLPQLAASPGAVGRLRVRRELRAALRDAQTFKIIGPAMVTHALAVVAETTEAEAVQMFAEVPVAA